MAKKKKGLSTGAAIGLGVAGAFALLVWMVPRRMDSTPRWIYGPSADSEGRITYGWNWLGDGEPTSPMPTGSP